MTLALSSRNTAHVVLLALDSAEERLMPAGSHSRLWVARECVDSLITFLSVNPPDRELARECLLARLDDVLRVQGVGRQLGNLTPTIGRAFDLTIHVTQAALVDAEPSTERVLCEARLLVRNAGRHA